MLDAPLMLEARRALFEKHPGCEAPVRHVLWVDRSWALSQSDDAREIDSLIVKRFAFQVARGNDEPSCHFDVDAYGATGIARYGGSGRAGVLHGYQIKGIGVTQFVDPNADWTHSHGRLPLKEAIREVIMSCVASQVFPYGAIPSLAIIELAEELKDENGETQRLALLVRPFAIRPSHFQRALGFHRNMEGMGHLADVDRVKDMVHFASNTAPELIRSFARRLGSQIATMHNLGWFHGGLYSSSVCINAELIDFGSSRFVPDREARSYDVNGPKFGSEMEGAKILISSWCYYWNRYAHGCRVDENAAFEQLIDGYVTSMPTLIGSVVGRYSWEYLNMRIEELMLDPKSSLQSAIDRFIREIVSSVNRTVAR